MRILIVDDSRFSQTTASKLLQMVLGEAEIILAGDGEEGLAKYREFNPDYILIDLLMPKIDGQTLIKIIKDYDDKAKIFVISADVQNMVRLEIEAIGIKAFINKPFTQEKAELVASIIRDDENAKP